MYYSILIFSEYCQLEFFRPRCWKNEIIMMEEATYGRMEIGRCIEAEDDLAAFESNPRFIGCSVDVLDVLDRRCSGNASCDVSVTDSELEVKTRPCYKGLFMYLKVAYRCISGWYEKCMYLYDNRTIWIFVRK